MSSLWWLLIGFLAGAASLGVFLGLVGRPHKHRNVSYAQLPTLIRELMDPLNDRGRIYVSHKDATGEIWLQKCVRKVKPSTFSFRYRNTDMTKEHFDTVRAAFQATGITVDLELTEKLRAPRALRVDLETDQAASYSGVANLIRAAFEAIGAQEDGRLVVYAVNNFRLSQVHADGLAN